MSKEKVRVDIGGKEKYIEIIDDDHLWFGGMQYISLKRLNELRHDTSKELRNFRDRVQELTEENEAYRVLLKQSLGMDVVCGKGE